MPAPRDHARAPSRAATIAFAGATLDRAAHLRAEADQLRQLDTSRAVVVGAEQDVGLTDAGTLSLIPVSALPPDAPLTFLGIDASNHPVFAYETFDHGSPQGAELVSLRSLAAELDAAEAGLAAYAAGMVGWHRVTRHCGRCGHATEIEQAGHRRRCPNCGLVHFPRTDPVVTMLVSARDHCVLSRRVGAPENRWSALAGFMEPGETPEQAIVREAREETGLAIHRVEYVASQPWPFPAALMLGYWAFADPDSAGATTLTPEPGELVEARWWERDELKAALADDQIVIPPAGTIGNFLISTWLENNHADGSD